MKRVMIFIDGPNFLHGFKATSHSGKHLDYRKLGEKLAALASNRELLRIYFFCSIPNQADARDPAQFRRQQSFLEKLQYNGIKVTALPLRKRPNGDLYEKGVDVHLVTDLLQLGFKDAYDVAVVVSGDGDFVPAIEAVMALGKRVEVAAFRGSKSANIHKNCDQFYFLDEILDSAPSVFF